MTGVWNNVIKLRIMELLTRPDYNIFQAFVAPPKFL
jgi:hypothetical protein